MPMAGAAIMGGGALVGGIGGAIISANAMEDAQAQEMAARQAALSQFTGLEKEIPTLASQQLTYRPFEYVGDYTPEQQALIQQQQSEMKGVETDPRLQQAQMQSLQQLSALSQGGLSQADLAGLEQIRQQTAASQQANQNAVMQNMAERGMGGGGAELAARLSATQNAAQSQQNQGLAQAQMAQARQLQATGQVAQLGGAMQAQSFGQQSQIAQAQDIINRFNTQQQTGTNQANVQAANQAGLRKADLQQNIAQSNIGQQGKLEEMQKITIPQSHYNDLMGLASAKANALVGMGQAAGAAGQQKAQMWGQIGSGISGAAGTIGGAMMSRGGGSSAGGGGVEAGGGGGYNYSTGANTGSFSNPGFSGSSQY